MSYGASYEQYNTLFLNEASEIHPSIVYRNLGLVTVLLLVLTLLSLATALMVNLKNKSHVSYLVSASIASLSIGFGSILLSNYVGVYI
ncbi:hypothetical protein CANTEDRAFT_116974 [Yamadazyma tenuis ATCC 10573]|uniref:Dolichyl-diphosphooligosaccharide-protein glycosyltransferase subunit OST5 n=1 Tax=Candida tenuis (strain ATCC 10573 / BCRC 21748 / CBS 615 / JCM 9827 / NBRC 10315 / NRRL Y-1498 / VKM Y-70) TaxID=590646 RepID=G3BDB5_CANTC|nr:uncharacterized protein CANTEDRAFT_116974 [Yamadazyma tenuis ATCC 10573]XP_006690523.1 uncharacterized protein CANTEDRAFT_116974 [Yamadazyma tenuis ATCC 10573]EGV61308.1 hypothetical protein CANTEDRAFT_116974 [Yamadazyma tenuis ATCC 10573]EGV61309.1 hypothetical protein CANTEDRAFT_116974 [Yamadazyma tenuis ATCC 10573]